MAHIIVTMGYPGSGKTYFSKQFAEEFNYFHLNSDNVRWHLFKSPKYTWNENKIVFAALDYFAAQILSRGQNVIYDANLSKKVSRRKLLELAEKVGAQYFLFWFNTSPELALERLNARKDKLDTMHVNVTKDVFEKMSKEIEPPINEPHLVISGAEEYAIQKKRAQNYISSLKH